MLWVVEAWRGVASVLVVWAHWASPLGLPRGISAFSFTGVDLFFVLSGFVFAPVLLQRPVPSLRAYGLRRVVRIYPAYMVALALYVALAWMEGRPIAHLPEHVLMLHLQSREMAFYYNPAFWSLPVEVAFYALLPLLGAWQAHGRAPDARARRSILWLLSLALALRMALLGLADGATQNYAYVLLNHVPGLLIEFFLGAWVWQRAQRPSPRALTWLWGIAGLLGWCVLAVIFVHLPTTVPSWLSGQMGLGAALCFAALLLASLQLSHPGNAVLAAARWSGRLSYSVYLLHMAWLAPALTWSERWGAATGSAMALTGLIMTALALHWFVEEPARRWGRSQAERWEQSDAALRAA